ncbi:Suppressor of G2 allele of SKP1 [Clydaea vesicula]|uniref:Suppressor of G2 allele of SKP1 n=1 Tax=Clydaea vesicula TaxID=447962 RepID=A0AAD5XWN2_9FUNG|nr:Suppressor of G2 allele of SKP1 [Clydaea vesicula]
MTTIDSFINLGNSNFVDEDFKNAKENYTRAIQLEPGNSDIYLKRSNANFKLKEYLDSKNDAEAAIKLSKGNTDITVKANFRKGIAFYHLKEYQQALDSFIISENLAPNNNETKIWISKCLENGAVKTAESLSSKRTEETNKVAASNNLQQQTEEKKVEQIFPSRIRHEWYQDDNFVTISVFIKNVKKDTVTIDFTENSLSLLIKLPTQTDFTLELEPLSHKIAPSDSKYSVLSTKIEIKLKKAIYGTKWNTLEGEDKLVTNLASANNKPEYPSSAKNKKDWNKIEKEVTDEKPEGEQALNALFQSIYKDATPETQKAMIKSFTESGGTCLSTNWDEVGKKKVEISPPDGMVARKYDQ